MTIRTRDVRLDLDQLRYGLTAVQRRRRELEKRNETYRRNYEAGVHVKHGMWDALQNELQVLRQLEDALLHNHEALRREHTNAIRRSLGLETQQ